MQLSDFTPGLSVTVTGTNRTNGHGHVTKVGRKYVYVLIAGNERPGQYLPSEVTPRTFTSNPSPSYLASVAAEHKLRSTTRYTHPDAPKPLTSRQRRTQRRSGGAADISRMMLAR